MAISLTLDAVRQRRKTVTRRAVESWRTLKPGDRLALIEKGMGLPKGAKQVVVAEVEVVSVTIEPISEITVAEVVKEGFEGKTPEWFIDFWLRSHHCAVGGPARISCRRIEWRYL